jgi:hypothetical protein
MPGKTSGKIERFTSPATTFLVGARVEPLHDMAVIEDPHRRLPSGLKPKAR